MAPAGSVTAVPCSAYTCRASGRSSHSVAATPSGASAVNTARPVTPAPATNTGAPGVSSDNNPSSSSRAGNPSSSSRAGSPWSSPSIGPAMSGPDCGEPLAVEQGHTQTAGDRRQQPEPDDDRGLGPTHQ